MPDIESNPLNTPTQSTVAITLYVQPLNDQQIA